MCSYFVYDNMCSYFVFLSFFLVVVNVNIAIFVAVIIITRVVFVTGGGVIVPVIVKVM